MIQRVGHTSERTTVITVTVDERVFLTFTGMLTVFIINFDSNK